MDGKQGPDEASSVAGHGDEDLQELLAFCSRVLRDQRQPEDRAGILEQYRRLDELHSAIDALLMRFRLDVFLGSVPGVTPGSSPMASEAVERFRRAINVIARRDT
ncbi:hypothetical protein [Arthrobacter humicola]|jgi:hypothetical protein|uniref:hypothetical protein n=1 Tax=Arthrobacter humicola TaxID=409291 RepID=UPI001FAC9ED7|nr:hypothetical protein [Arthrobacter humicola]MCI9871770.1 hypothetical protein [Arthrobacter humicola]